MPRLDEKKLNRLKYLSGYRLNESPVYKPMFDDLDVDDSLPEEIVQPISQNDSNIHEDGENITGDTQGDSPELGVDPLATPDQSADMETDKGVGEPNVDIQSQSDIGAEQKSPDVIQNDIIRSNIEIMKKLNQKMEDLENRIIQLNSENQDVIATNLKLQKDVEEVREPTNVEKLMSRKQDSHPFYYNLNDLWKGNWFESRRDQFNEKGIKQLEDGTYIADFDDLPKYSSFEVKKSFDQY